MSRIVVPRSDQPRVSLVITAYGKADMTCEALAAIASNTPPMFETILVESDSPENSAEAVTDRVEGVDVVRCENHGFGYAQNVGFQRIRSPFMCVMSNDLVVEPGWLEPMVERFADPRVGIVVPKLLNPDGSLQEAGLAMGSDGFPWRWGQGYPPNAEEVSFPRAVDYGTACMLTRSEAFAAAGGFRPEYGLGYLEDADLALTVASLGWRAVYEPRAQMVHLNHGTFGEERAQQLSIDNRPKLLARWADALADRPPLEHGALHPDFTVRARDALCSHRILLVAHNEGWSQRARALQGLLPESRVSVLVVGHPESEAATDLLAGGIEVVRPADPTRWLADRRGHADLVWVYDDEAMAECGPALASSQRQAAWIINLTAALPPAIDDDLPEPPRTFVVSPDQVENARAAFPDAIVLPSGTPLPTLLAAAGILGG